MRKEDCQDVFRRIPEDTHSQVNLALRNGCLLSIDTVVRFEPHYMVFRGREGGSTEEGRAFFVPYDEICYLKIERVTRLGELKQMYGETGYVDAEDRLSARPAEKPVEPEADGPAVSTPLPMTSPLLPNDPASIAKQNLLNRIRAARANVAGSTGKLGGGSGGK